MRKGHYNIVVDGQWGSTGKGAVAGYLAWKHRPEIIATTNMANAGHTVVDVDPARTCVAKALPSPAVLNAWYDDYSPQIVVGPSAAFNLPQMLKEIDVCKLADDQLLIHSRAGIITDGHCYAESELTTGTKHIASTMQGCGTFTADKIMRRPGLRLATDYPELQQYMPDRNLPMCIARRLKDGATALHEGSQGFSLDIHHGSHYPACTSRQCTSTQALADMGIPIRHAGDVYLVIRPFPIRVGNVVENGQTVGHSGGHYDDHEEMTWQQVGELAGMPQDKIDELNQRELTTVTKRLRRVFGFSTKQITEAAAINGATRIALSFANYLDYSVYGTNKVEDLTKPVWDFVRKVEDLTGVPVTLIGTGPQLNHVVDLS